MEPTKEIKKETMSFRINLMLFIVSFASNSWIIEKVRVLKKIFTTFESRASIPDYL